MVAMHTVSVPFVWSLYRKNSEMHVLCAVALYTQVSSFCVSLAICSSWARQSATTSRQHPPSIPHQHGKPEQPSRTQRHRESHANERAAHEHVGWPTVWLRVAGGVGLATGVALLVQGVLIVMDRLVLRPRRRQRKGVGQCVLAQGTKRDGRTDAACSVL